MMTNPPTHKMERYKLITDYLKHLTTLSTGSILLLAAFLEKIFPNPSGKMLVIVSLVGFMISVVASIVAYTYAILDFPGDGPRMTRTSTIAGGSALMAAWLGFLAGVASMMIFAIVNLFK